MTGARSVAGRATHPRAPWLGAAVAVLVWGATPAATKFAVGDIEPLTAGLLRTVLAGAAALAVVVARRMPLPRDSRGRALLALSAACSFTAFPLLFSLSLAYTSTAHAALIIAAAPVFTGIVGAIAERRRPGVAWWLGVAIALAGEAALIGYRGGGLSGGISLLGDLLALAACLAVSFGYVAGGRLAPRIGAWGATFWSLAAAGAVQLPFLTVLGPRVDWLSVTAAGWGGIVWLVLCSSLLGYVAWYWALATGGVARVAPAQFLQPVVSLVLAVVLFSEAMTAALAASALAILAGVAIARRG